MLHRIEDGDQGRARHDGVGQVQRIGICGAQRLQQAHHVIAEHPEQTGGHRRQIGGQLELGRRDQGAQGFQRGPVFRREDVGQNVGAARDLGLAVPAAPDHVRRQGDEGVAAVDGAALDRLEQAGVTPPVPDLQEG